MNIILKLLPSGVTETEYVESPLNDDFFSERIGDMEEIPYLHAFENRNIAFLQNESAKLLCLDPTVKIVKDGSVIDILCGNILVVATDGENYIGLNSEQEAFVKANLKTAPISLPTPYLLIT